MSMIVIWTHYVANDSYFLAYPLLSNSSLYDIKIAWSFHLCSFLIFLLCIIFHIPIYLIPVPSSKPSPSATFPMRPFLTIVAPSGCLTGSLGVWLCICSALLSPGQRFILVHIGGGVWKRSQVKGVKIQWQWHCLGWMRSSLQLIHGLCLGIYNVLLMFSSPPKWFSNLLSSSLKRNYFHALDMRQMLN